MCETPNFSVERMAAVVARLHVRALSARRHRSRHRSPKLRGERGRLKSYKDDEKIAQAQRDTSAGLGNRHKMVSSLFSNLVWRAQARQTRLEKREVGWWVAVYPGRQPRRLGPGLLSCRPFRGSCLRGATAR